MHVPFHCYRRASHAFALRSPIDQYQFWYRLRPQSSSATACWTACVSLHDNKHGKPDRHHGVLTPLVIL